MGYPTDTEGVKTSNSQVKMQVPSGAPIAAQPTSTIQAELNLDARATIAANATPPTPLGTYGTSITAFDSQGCDAASYRVLSVAWTPRRRGCLHRQPRVPIQTNGPFTTLRSST